MEKDRKHSKAMSNDENFKQLQMEGKVLLKLNDNFTNCFNVLISHLN